MHFPLLSYQLFDPFRYYEFQDLVPLSELFPLRLIPIIPISITIIKLKTDTQWLS